MTHNFVNEPTRTPCWELWWLLETVNDSIFCQISSFYFSNKMHSFVSSSAGSASLYPRRASRSGSITAFNQRRLSRVSDHFRHLSTGQIMAATVAASNVGTTGRDEKGDKCKLIQYEDPVLARTVTVEGSFRRMEVNRKTWNHYCNIAVKPCCHNTTY